MIPQAKRQFLLTLLVLAVLLPSPIYGQSGRIESPTVVHVIDGDTLQIPGGDRIRLLGIDAPERGDPLFDQALEMLQELTALRSLDFEICEDRDIYGRYLATVVSGKVNVNSVLLREGMALPMLIPPCGRMIAVEVLAAAALGAQSGKGIYSLGDYEIIPHTDAWAHLGKKAMVKGRVLGLHKGRRAWHFNFGKDWKTDFTAVLFPDGQRRFLDLGIDPAALVGREVLVIGKIKDYNGPEIIVRGPDRIIPLEEKAIQGSRSKIQKETSE